MSFSSHIIAMCSMHFDEFFRDAQRLLERVTSPVFQLESQILGIEDPDIDAVDPRQWNHEMISLWLEMYSVACMHRFKKPESVVLQSFFTWIYLHALGRVDIWDSMNGYNFAIAEATMRRHQGQLITPILDGREQRVKSAFIKDWSENGSKHANLSIDKVRFAEISRHLLGDEGYAAKAQIENHSELHEAYETSVVRSANRMFVDVDERSSSAFGAVAPILGAQLGCGADFDGGQNMAYLLFVNKVESLFRWASQNLEVGLRSIKVGL